MLKDKEFIAIAIDGPSASGKSTVSKRVAEELGYIFVDSGSLYRGMTWKALQEKVDVKDTAQVLQMMGRMRWKFYIEGDAMAFTIDGINPGKELRGEPVRERVSDIAAIPEVRAFIVESLQDMSHLGNITMEGRDIGTVVFPDSPFKFYIDADPEERARRRLKDVVALEGKGDVKKVLDSLTKRDKKDTTRKTAPLQIALGATVINSTDLSIEEVVARIVNDVRQQDGEQ